MIKSDPQSSIKKVRRRRRCVQVPPDRVPEALAISPLKMHRPSSSISTSLTPRKE